MVLNYSSWHFGFIWEGIPWILSSQIFFEFSALLLVSQALRNAWAHLSTMKSEIPPSMSFPWHVLPKPMHWPPCVRASAWDSMTSLQLVPLFTGFPCDICLIKFLSFLPYMVCLLWLGTTYWQGGWRRPLGVSGPGPPSWHGVMGPWGVGDEAQPEGDPWMVLLQADAVFQPGAVWGLCDTSWWLPPSSYLQNNLQSIITSGE